MLPPYQERMATRRTIFLSVLALHAALIAALLSGREPRPRAAPPEPLLFLPAPVTPPRAVRADTGPLPRLAPGLPLAPLVPVPMAAGPIAAEAAGTMRRGPAAVDWLAERRRAIEAYQIRAGQPEKSAVASPLQREPLRPAGDHRPAEWMKTESGDWIVWIDADCYQIARAQPGFSAAPSGDRANICPGEPRD